MTKKEKDLRVETLDAHVGNMEIHASGFFDKDDTVTIDGQEMPPNVAGIQIIMDAQEMIRVVVTYYAEGEPR